MKVVIDIPKDFTEDYIADKFKDFFSRVIADIDNYKGMCGRYECGRYEKEIAEMFLKAFDDSEGKISCNCKHGSNLRDNEPCCRCDSRKTNADRIRNMSDEELPMFIGNLAECINCDLQCLEKCITTIDECCRKHLEWLQSEAE